MPSKVIFSQTILITKNCGQVSSQRQKNNKISLRASLQAAISLLMDSQGSLDNLGSLVSPDSSSSMLLRSPKSISRRLS